MRLLGALVVGLILYFAVPMLWQRAMVAKVDEISASQPGIPVAGEPIVENFEASNIANAMNPQINIETGDYQRIAAQSAADDAMRQAQAAQDQAWRATHGQMP